MAFDFAWKSYSSKPVREKVEKRNKDGSIKYNKDGSIQYGIRINAGALAQNIAGNGMMMGYGLLSQIPEKPDAENTNNTVAKDVRSHINDAMMQSGNPYLMGAAFLDQGLNKLGWGATATNAKELGTLSNVGNTALASTPVIGAVAGKLFGTSTAQKYKSDLLEGSKMFNWQSDADGLFGAKGVVFNGNKAKKLVDDKNMKLNLADSILHDAKRDFTTDIGMIAQRINMDLTGGPDRVTNFGPAAAKQGAVLQFTKRTLSKHKIKKQQSDKPEEVITQEPINEQVDSFKEGGKVNVIPEGALHKNKHHLEEVDEKFEDVTTKGIPVIVESEDGEVIQQAEVEREEIIFRLEVTKKLEELSKKHTDEAAIEAGKLLVKEILYNTEDNTGKMI